MHVDMHDITAVFKQTIKHVSVRAYEKPDGRWNADLPTAVTSKKESIAGEEQLPH